jgi:5-amino-6-(5-phosphoribosylamino)uracil reductase
VLAHDLPVLTDTEVPPLVLTCADAAPGARARLGSAAEVLDCSTTDRQQVDMAAALDRLAERGLMRVLTEGGPSLLGTIVERDLLDELCLTVAPTLVGGDAPRITASGAEVLAWMRCAHVLNDPDGYLYTRYTRAR